MDIYYRKNDSWGTLSFEVLDLDYLDLRINEEVFHNIETNDNVDIIDVKINSFKNGYGKREHHIIVFYALIRNLKRKEI